MANLQNGTRIFGQANVDTTLYVNSTMVANASGVYHTGTVNAASHTVGSTFIANSTAVTLTTNTLTLGTSSITANGYSRLPNGLLMQWGTHTASVNSTTPATATFPIAFPTALYSISVMVLQAGTGADASVANTANTTAVVWKNGSTGGAVSKQMYYTAIGV